MQIQFLSSLIIDALSYLECGIYEKDEEFIVDFNNKCNYEMPKDLYYTSTLSYIISVYCNNEQMDTYTLDDLIAILENINEVSEIVLKKMENDLNRSFILPVLEMLKNGYDLKYINALKVIKNNGFEEMWERNIKSIIDKSIIKKKFQINKNIINNIVKNIMILKNEAIENIKIYITFGTNICFKLYKNAFTDVWYESGEKNIHRILAHELMHGFSTDEIRDNYNKYVNSNEDLIKKYKILKSDFHSSDEEEMVMGAEYYLLSLAGYYNEAILNFAENRYNGCCPTAVKIFEEIIKEKTVPIYNDWLKTYFNKI